MNMSSDYRSFFLPKFLTSNGYSTFPFSVFTLNGLIISNPRSLEASFHAVINEISFESLYMLINFFTHKILSNQMALDLSV
jgi:hypothetical protein